MKMCEARQADTVRKIRLRKVENALIKKKIKFSSYIGKFRVEQLQSHI